MVGNHSCQAPVAISHHCYKGPLTVHQAIKGLGPFTDLKSAGAGGWSPRVVAAYHCTFGPFRTWHSPALCMLAVSQEILNGGVDICREAGIPLAGGHSIDSPEPIFGLVVAGIVDPARVARNSAARAGDVLLLTKPLGVGVMTTALKKGLLPPEGYTEVDIVRQIQYVPIHCSLGPHTRPA